MSVTKRIRNGKTRWVARYRGGNGREYSKTFDTKCEATAWVAERERELRRGEWADPQAWTISVAEDLEQYANTAMRPTTQRVRLTAISTLGELHDMPINKIRRHHIEQWQARLLNERGLNISTVKSYRASLSGMFERHINDGILPRNPVRGVALPAREHATIEAKDIPSREWVHRLINEFEHRATTRPVYSCYALMTRVGASTGMRPSEIAGLATEDLDFPNRRIHVTRQAARVGGERVALKTLSSRRYIPIHVELREELRRWVAAHPDPEGRLFRTTTGAPMKYPTMFGALERTVRESGLPGGLTWHSLRHFHATELLRAGVPVKSVQARLGHASAAMTSRCVCASCAGG